MAKKVVATLQTAGKDWAKVIRTMKSEKTGAYYFKEDSVPLAVAKELPSALLKYTVGAKAGLKPYALASSPAF